jgi:dihydropyrimidinase
MKTLIKNGTLVTASETFRADLLLDGERIALMGLDLPAEGETTFALRGEGFDPAR